MLIESNSVEGPCIIDIFDIVLHSICDIGGVGGGGVNWIELSTRPNSTWSSFWKLLSGADEEDGIESRSLKPFFLDGRYGVLINVRFRGS